MQMQILRCLACVALLDTFSGSTPVTDVTCTGFKTVSHGTESLELHGSSFPHGFVFKKASKKLQFL